MIQLENGMFNPDDVIVISFTDKTDVSTAENIMKYFQGIFSSNKVAAAYSAYIDKIFILHKEDSLKESRLWE